MQTREEIEKSVAKAAPNCFSAMQVSQLLLENILTVLLDIRELLLEKRGNKEDL